MARPKAMWTAYLDRSEAEPWVACVPTPHQTEVPFSGCRPLRRELEDAHRIQQLLLPRSFPAVQGLEGAGQCRPASDVGGDYYDYFPMSDGNLALAIGDVCGKGIPAALLMATLQASMRRLATHRVTTLSSLMTALNRLFYESTPDNRFATLFLAAYHPGSHELKYVNAGHLPPLVLRHQGSHRLSDGGPAIGLFPTVDFEQSSVTLRAGDIVALFTDGITEATNTSGYEFGEQRLARALQCNTALRAEDLVEQVFNRCLHFTSGTPQQDDMTLLILRSA